MNKYIYQSTIVKPVSFSGISLHTGSYSKVLIFPACPNEGITFTKRLSSSLFITNPFHIIGTSFCTELGSINHFRFSIKTIEHLMGALFILQLSNLRIEVDGPEIPIVDGSSIFWFKLLKNNIITQNILRVKKILKKIIFVIIDDSFIIVTPSSSLSINYGVDFYSSLKVNYLNWSFLPIFIHGSGVYSQILGSRTFGTKTNLSNLKQQELIQGANLYNALLLNNNFLAGTFFRHPKELVNHKILDFLGDLNLISNLSNVFVIAYKSNHYLNNFLARLIFNYSDEAISI
uniref:UDP-3-O-acyl-N-acetylglucosamine deacetylase n=1 Tax=Cyanidium sp. THAL103 TaxID=3027999 RepID=A0A9Y1MYG8_9RHOD|nr:UDP-3-0-acyl N-acetylglucosamine deacetylase [Cyanidium sp. THAL103]